MERGAEYAKGGYRSRRAQDVGVWYKVFGAKDSDPGFGTYSLGFRKRKQGNWENVCLGNQVNVDGLEVSVEPLLALRVHGIQILQAKCESSKQNGLGKVVCSTLGFKSSLKVVAGTTVLRRSSGNAG